MTFIELAREIQENRKAHNDLSSRNELIKAGKKYISSKLEIVFLSKPELDKELIFNLEDNEEDDEIKYEDFLDENDECFSEIKQLYSPKEVKDMFTPLEYPDEQKKALKEYEDELIRVVSLFWYAVCLNYFSKKTKTQEEIKTFLKRYERKNYSNTKGRQELIINLFKRHKETILLCIFNHFKNYCTDKDWSEKSSYLFGIPNFSVEKISSRKIWNRSKSQSWIQELHQAYFIAAKCITSSINKIHTSFNESILENNPYVETGNRLELSEMEVEMIRYICEIIPDSRKDKNKLIDGYWETLSQDSRYTLMEYIRELSNNPQVLNRYLMAENYYALKEKLYKICVMILYPQYDRIVRNLKELNEFFKYRDCCDIKADEKTLINCDKYLRRTKEQLGLKIKRRNNEPEETESFEEQFEEFALTLEQETAQSAEQKSQDL